jgi:hypothetical protein
MPTSSLILGMVGRRSGRGCRWLARRGRTAAVLFCGSKVYPTRRGIADAVQPLPGNIDGTAAAHAGNRLGCQVVIADVGGQTRSVLGRRAGPAIDDVRSLRPRQPDDARHDQKRVSALSADSGNSRRHRGWKPAAATGPGDDRRVGERWHTRWEQAQLPTADRHRRRARFRRSGRGRNSNRKIREKEEQARSRRPDSSDHQGSRQGSRPTDGPRSTQRSRGRPLQSTIEAVLGRRTT